MQPAAFAEDVALKRWLVDDPDPQARLLYRAAENAAAAGDREPLRRLFGRRLGLGTAGMRGPFGPGPAGINRLTLRDVTTAFGDMLRDAAAGEGAVAIAYDARPQGACFAADAAAVLGAQGFEVVLFAEPTPTPLLAYCVRQQKLIAGMMITASHNPASDGGVKLFGADGAQLGGAQEAQLEKALAAAASRSPVLGDLAAARAAGRCRPPAADLPAAYLASLTPPAALLKPHPKGVARLRIAYSALHGVGGRWVEAALRDGPFELHVVAEQQQPDGRFLGLPQPNPELPEAMAAVRTLGQRVGADLVLANDPDADRLAAAVADGHGGHLRLDGNQVGLLLADWIAEQPLRPQAMVTTLVSSRLLARLCRARGLTYVETWTGFKHLAAAARAQRQAGVPCSFLYEEALGYCVDVHGADKDGIAALRWLAQLAAQQKARGSSLLARLSRLYRELGLWLCGQQTLSLAPGIAGGAAGWLARLPKAQLAGHPVEALEALLQGHGAAKPPHTAAADLYIYALAGGARVVLRPSGTEPKMKIYYELPVDAAASLPLEEARRLGQAQLQALMAAHRVELLTCCPSATKALAIDSGPR